MDKLMDMTAFCERNYGIATTKDLITLGFSEDQIHRLVRSGRLERRHRTVFRLRGAPISWEQELLAACRWAGKKAVASHRAAARLWGLDGFGDQIVEVTTPARRKSAAGVRLHQRNLPPHHREIRLGIPVTSIGQTLLDLGSVAHAGRVEIALDSAFRKGFASPKALRDMLVESGKRGVRGTKILRRLLGERTDGPPSESPLETKMLRLLRRGGLPAPQQQIALGDEGSFVGRVDFFYPEQKLVIEVDGYSYHHGRQAWQSDLHRQNLLASTGLSILRFSEHDVDRRPTHVLKCVKRFFSMSPAESAG